MKYSEIVKATNDIIATCNVLYEYEVGRRSLAEKVKKALKDE